MQTGSSFSPRMSMSARSRPGTASPRATLRIPGLAVHPPPAIVYGQELSPRSPRFRPQSATSSIRPTSAAVRAGGRLYVQSPLDGMSENEMINEARLRIQHNKQRPVKVRAERRWDLVLWDSCAILCVCVRGR